MIAERFRLVDGVVLAAVGLLGLKVLGVFSGERTAAAPAVAPPFAQVIAHARSNTVAADPTTTGSVGAAPPAPAPASPEPAAAAPVPPAPAGSKTERALLERLGERREELQQRGREMETREKLLEDNERRLDERLTTLKAEEEKRQAAEAARRAGAEATGLKSLVTMYETMKPKEAARVFERLPSDVLLPVVTAMNPRKMAEVMAAKLPETAQKLTVNLAKRIGGKADDKPAAAVPGLPAGELPAIELPRR